ncbi:KIF13B [Symbiodinium natans]|uniref:KIF13B protein n=1 Tax=Symbiodinium natans TaxID=878477 RepID=A0A812P2I9_9DINO|nr:KIF13B [Symbiodinium natans]
MTMSWAVRPALLQSKHLLDRRILTQGLGLKRKIRPANLLKRLRAIQSLREAYLTTSALQQLGLGATEGPAEDWMDQSTGQVLCSVSYDLRIPGAGATLREPGRVHASGGRPDADGLDLLRAVALRFPRDRDAEFLALTSVVAAIRRAVGPGLEMSEAEGSVRLHASHVPCLSCLGVMVQFREAFPKIELKVSFDDARSAVGEKPA